MTLPPNLISKLRKKPNTCPYCKSTLLDASSPTIDDYDDILKIHVRCTNCLKEWLEVYTLTSVENACTFDEETCKSIDYRSVSGNRSDDYASIPCEHYEKCKKRYQS